MMAHVLGFSSAFSSTSRLAAVRGSRWVRLVPSPVVVLALAIFVATSVGPLTAQDDHCDPIIQRKAWGGPFAYQLRNDRCEGLYTNEVGAHSLWLASLTESFEDYELDASKPLIVRWDAPGGSAVRLQAHGVEPSLFYRMDSRRPEGDKVYIWSSEVLATQEIEQRDVGVLGWTDAVVAGEPRRLYVPIRIGQSEEAFRSGTYTLTLVPNRRFRELYVSVALVDSVGMQPTTERQYVKHREPLGKAPYGSQSAIRVEIADLPRPGIYWFSITARSNGSEVTLGPRWFYHAPRSRPDGTHD